MNRGSFIVFEGPEGSGKSSALQSAAEMLEERGYTVVCTREPGSPKSKICANIRELLLISDPEMPMNAMTELYLFLADRSRNISEVVLPALERGEIVLCDRHVGSSIAYQGFGRKLESPEWIHTRNMEVTGGLTPDLVLLLDVQPETGIARRHTTDEVTRLDKEDIEFHHQVREGFLAQANVNPEKWQVIDANLPIETVKSNVIETLVDFLDTGTTPDN